MIDIEEFEKQAGRRKKGLIAFLDKLDEIVPEGMPELVAQKDKEVWREVNCMECANCCKTMTPTFTKEDVVRISAHLKMSAKDFKKKWLKLDDEGKALVNTTQPCQFLVDNKCSIYEVRPIDCAEFPHHDKTPFDEYNQTFKNNIIHCPATYNLISRLKKTVERDYEW